MNKKAYGFTIVELLIVIVVIGILAAITIVAYNGVQKRANDAKMQSDLSELKKAVIAAREVTQKTFNGMTGSGYTATGCASKAAGTDLAALPKTDSCWVRYNAALDVLSTASGINVRNVVDPWGRPYMIDENEGENGTSCNRDVLAVYANPTNGSIRYLGVLEYVPLSGYSGCAI